MATKKPSKASKVVKLMPKNEIATKKSRVEKLPKKTKLNRKMTQDDEY